MTKELREKIMEYLEPGRNESWQEVAEKFGVTTRQAKYAGELLKTPSSEDFEQVTVKHTLTVPEGFRAVPKGFYANGTISYGLEPITEPFQDILARVCKPIKTVHTVKPLRITDNQFLVYSDVHIGMSTAGTIFDHTWAYQQVIERIDTMVANLSPKIPTTIVMLGDYIDGEEGFTASRTHKLQQNLTDNEMFKQGVLAARYLIEQVSKHSGVKSVLWVSNCNHNKSADYKIGITLQHIYPDLYIKVLDNFISHVEYEDYTLILTHGKDRLLRTRGLGLPLTDKDLNLIESYIREHHLGGKKVFLLRGDLHQPSFRDYATFTDIMCASFAPPSGWIAVNFGAAYKGGAYILNLGTGVTYSPINF